MTSNSAASTANAVLPQAQRGSATIESALVAFVLLALFSGIFSIGFVALAKVWLQFASYEAAICLATTARESTCRAKLENRFSGVLPGANANGSTIHLHRNTQFARVDLQYRLSDKLVFKESRRLQLPLRPDLVVRR